MFNYSVKRDQSAMLNITTRDVTVGQFGQIDNLFKSQ